MTEEYEVRFYLPRSGNLDQEIQGARPWAVASRHVVNVNDLVIATALRKSGRLRVSTTPPLGKRSGIDLQHLWTFLSERDVTIQKDEPIRALDEDSIRRLCDGIAERLLPVSPTPHVEDSCQIGRVVFVALERGTSEYLYVDGDFPAIRANLWKRFKIRWPGDPEFLPAVVVANRSSQHSGSKLDIVTVVPLLEAPDLLERFPGENPRIGRPDGGDDLAAITQCLLSVSTNERDERIRLESGDLRSWTIDRGELRVLLDDIALWLGVRIPWPND